MSTTVAIDRHSDVDLRNFGIVPIPDLTALGRLPEHKYIPCLIAYQCHISMK